MQVRRARCLMWAIPSYFGAIHLIQIRSHAPKSDSDLQSPYGDASPCRHRKRHRVAQPERGRAFLSRCPSSPHNTTQHGIVSMTAMLVAERMWMWPSDRVQSRPPCRSTKLFLGTRRRTRTKPSRRSGSCDGVCCRQPRLDVCRRAPSGCCSAASSSSWMPFVACEPEGWQVR